MLVPKSERDFAVIYEHVVVKEPAWSETEEGQPLPLLASTLRVKQPGLAPPVTLLIFLTKLQFAASCRLSSLHPAWLRYAPLLSLLDVRNNQLRTLPVEAASIETVLMEGNPDLDLNGIDNWREYLQLRATQSTPQRRLKLLLVGMEGVGTALD